MIFKLILLGNLFVQAGVRSSINSTFSRHTVPCELTHNARSYVESNVKTLKLKLIRTTRRSVDVIVLRPLAEGIEKAFVDGEFVYWPLHPNNTSTLVPFVKGPVSSRSIDVNLTASRSVSVIDSRYPSFTIKTGTDYPHRQWREIRKVDTKDDVNGALLRQPHIDRIDRMAGQDPILQVIPEALILRHKSTGQGVIIRDLSVLDENRIYIPALSLPYVWKPLADRSGMSIFSFLKSEYMDKLGQIKARLLLRYGLEMETPNAQNFLIESDTDYIPTGKIFIRDIGDSLLYEPWAKAYGSRKLAEENSTSGFMRNDLRPAGETSLMHFDLVAERSLERGWMENLDYSHDRNWSKEIADQLGLPGLSRYSPVEMHRFLSSNEGIEAIKRYLLKMKII